VRKLYIGDAGDSPRLLDWLPKLMTILFIATTFKTGLRVAFTAMTYAVI
jgi:hypothetical protein